jgi:uroporphyrinogen-III decarboxylase
MTVKPYTDPDIGKSPEQLLAERTKRIQDALHLKQPDRIPIQIVMGYMIADMYGVTHQEQHENPEKSLEITEKAALHFQPDSLLAFFTSPGPSLALGDVMVRYPGHSLDANGSFQFVEGEYMKEDEYDAFIDDPGDWAIRKYWPRVFPELEGLSLLPPLGMAGHGTYSLFNLGVLRKPPVVKALRALAKAVEADAEAEANIMRTMQRLAGLGFAPPTFIGCNVLAPFDFISDTLRGMRGSMMDMYRRPEKLLAAEEKILRFELEHAIAWCRATGIYAAGIALHRGSDGFMSLPQFERFYWPQYKALLEGLMAAGIRATVGYEGTWDQRLHYLTELPKGMHAGWFDRTDIFKAKEIVGDTMCICGGMPNSLLQGGTAEEVRDLTIKVCREVGKGGGFLMTTTIQEMQGCKPELVRVWIDTTKEYGVYT